MATSVLKPHNISTEKDREEFVVSYIPYVNSVAKAVSRQFGCRELDELRSCGYQGLLEATDNFDVSKNVNFKYYAYIRIYGHMLDYMRKLYAGSNATVVLKKKINKLLELKKACGEDVDSEKLAKELDMTLEDFQKAQDKINNTTFVLNFTDLAGHEHSTEGDSDYRIAETFVAVKALPEDDLILVDQLWKVLADRFPDRERKIMERIYQQELTYPDIAKEFGITDRRVSQIHLDVLSRLNKLVKKGVHTKNKETRIRKKKV